MGVAGELDIKPVVPWLPRNTSLLTVVVFPSIILVATFTRFDNK